MNRLPVIIIAVLVIALIEWYTYHGLRAAMGGFNAPWKRVVQVLFWLMTLSTLLSIVLFSPMSQHPFWRQILTIMATVGVANVLGKIFFSLWLVLDDVMRLARFAWMKLNPPAPTPTEDQTGITRMQFLAQAGAVSAVIPLTTMAYGALSGAHDYRVIKRTIAMKNLPKALDGLTITQLSDIHTGSFWNKKAVERGIELANAQRSDLIFFTGDLVNNTSSELKGWTDVFGKLKADMGVYSVLGNHDYGDYVAWSSPEEKRRNLQQLMQAQKEMGWDLLLDEHRMLRLQNEQLAVVGIQNWGDKGRFPKYGNLAKAVAGADDASVRLLLSHDPSHWRAEVVKDFPTVDMAFAGHTHGMQFGIEVGDLKWSPVKYFYPEWADLYQEGDQYLYVNRGFGYIGYPGRIGIRPEITVFTLKSA